MSSLGIGIFVLTYVLISARRLSLLGLDRPSGALLGAVLCVALGTLTEDQAIAAVHGPTLLLLLGVMGMGAFLDLDGFFEQLEHLLVHGARSPSILLGKLVWGAGLLSALITNDAVCVLGAPLVVRLVKHQRLPPLPYLLALCTAANTGSVATLVGNPQNMLCALLGNLSYGQHLLLAGPLALLCLGLNHLLLQLFFGHQLAQHALDQSAGRQPLSCRNLLTLAVIGATAVLHTLGASLPWTAAAAFTFLMLLHRRDTKQLWGRIDWSLLLFFASLFIVVEGFIQSGAPERWFQRFPLHETGSGGVAGTLRLAGLFLVGSNVVSNVPFILLIREQMLTLTHPNFGWELLAVASTFAGNLTLLGSVANIIVAESARELGGLGFFQYLKVGAPLALLSTLLGALWLYIFLPGGAG